MPRHPYRTTRRLCLQVLDDRRVLAAIVGSVFNDADDSLRRDIDESGLEKRLVYVDQNNNAQMDQGERYALTDATGAFSIDDLSDGDYAVRLLTSTQSQVQTTPSSATLLHDVVLRGDISAAVPAMVLDVGTSSERSASAVLASGTRLQAIATDGTLSDPVDVGGEITQMLRLADGSLAVFANSDDGGQALIFDDTLSNPTHLGSTGSDTYVVSAGGDDLGRSVAVVSATDGGPAELWTVDRENGLMSATGVMVDPGADVTGDVTPRSDDGPTRSVISQASLVDDGNGGVMQTLAISLWSNTDASMLGGPIVVSGANEVVAFSDQAGLLVLRTGDNLSVYDVDNNLATMYSIDDTQPVAAIDAGRGLIVVSAPRWVGREGLTEDAGLRLIDSETGALVADMPIDLTPLGELDAVSLDADLRSVVITGATGLAQLSLRQPTAARVSVVGGSASPVEFGIQLSGGYTSPEYAETPVISTDEDMVLSTPLPLATAGSGDGYVVLPLYAPQHGVATIGPDGQIDYTPDADFEGSDSLTVLVGDGRDFKESIVTINVTPVPDAPTGATAMIDPVPENTPPSNAANGFHPIGIINITDADSINRYSVEIFDLNYIADERFEVIDLEIFFVGPGSLDAEMEWSIPLIISVNDLDSPETTGSLEFLTAVTVLDEDDPIRDITPDDASVQENLPGAMITPLSVVDEDEGQTHELTVDDDRFEVVDDALKLKDDIALDFEAANTITINVTATHEDDSFTKAIKLTVLDELETPENFGLTNNTVTELQIAAVVGDLTIDGNPAANGHSLTVNDSRFVIDGSTIRLADNTFIERTPGVDDEILIEITATPLASFGEAVTQDFVIAVAGNNQPFHNDIYPEDVNFADGVTAVDALTIINYLNTYGAGPVGEGDPALGYDVNSDGFVTSLDALLVINELNAISTGATGTVGNEPGGEPESESDNSAAPDVANDPVVPGPAPAPRPAPLRRVASQDLAIASLMEVPTTKTLDTPTASSMDEAAAVISLEVPRSHDDETRADKVFGEPEIDLLG